MIESLTHQRQSSAIFNVPMQPEGDVPNEYASQEATLSLLDVNPILTNSSKLAQQASQPIQLNDTFA